MYLNVYVKRYFISYELLFLILFFHQSIKSGSPLNCPKIKEYIFQINLVMVMVGRIQQSQNNFVQGKIKGKYRCLENWLQKQRFFFKSHKVYHLGVQNSRQSLSWSAWVCLIVSTKSSSYLHLRCGDPTKTSFKGWDQEVHSAWLNFGIN